MLLSPTWKGGVRSGFGSGVNLGEGVREPFPGLLSPTSPSRAQPPPSVTAAAFSGALPPVPRFSDGVGGRGGAARVLLQRAEEGSRGGYAGSGGGGGGGRVSAGGGEAGDVAAGEEESKGGGGGGFGEREGGGGDETVAIADGRAEIRPEGEDDAELEQHTAMNSIVATFVDDVASTTSSSSTGGAGGTAATTAATATGRLPSFSGGGGGADSDRVALPAAVAEDSWFNDDDGWHGFVDTNAGNGNIGGYDLENGETQGGMYGGGGGGKEVASYMRWGAEGGVWYGDGYRGGRDGNGDGEDGQWGAQQPGQHAAGFGAPARWSGISEMGAGVMRPADALGTGLEEHLPFMVTHTLVKVLRDPLLSAHYQV